MATFQKNIATRSLVAYFLCICFAHGLPRAAFTENRNHTTVSNDGLLMKRIDLSHSAMYNFGFESSRGFPKRPKVCNDCVCGVGRKTRIVGGDFTTIHEYPWVVGFLKHGEFHCGGSLITRNHVLTAAHCINGYDKKYFQLHLGDHDIKKLTENVHRRRIKSWVIHEEFNPHNFNNDIAIVELDKPVEVDGVIRTACLPENNAIDYSGSMAKAIGWGRIVEGGAVSEILRDVTVPVLSDEECNDSGYPTTRRTENMFCAGYLEGALDACSGDSGGPLLVRGSSGSLEIIGITSFGRGCARPRFPGVYTKLTNYLGWLQEQLKDDCVCPTPKRTK